VDTRRLAAQTDGCTVPQLVAEGIMAAVEAIECETGCYRGRN
jgi:hypothetical protein